MVQQSGGEALNRELTLLQTDLIFLGGLVENAITQSLDSLISRNLEQSKEVAKRKLEAQKRAQKEVEQERSDTPEAEVERSDIEEVEVERRFAHEL